MPLIVNLTETLDSPRIRSVEALARRNSRSGSLWSMLSVRDKASSLRLAVAGGAAMCASAILAVVVTAQAPPQAGGRGPQGFIGGVVESSQGPEAGVWVIAETTELPTKLIRRSWSRDDQGRFVLPELPKASYNVWVRGYGLADSTPVKAAPGGSGSTSLALKAVRAGSSRRRPQRSTRPTTGIRFSKCPARTSSRGRALMATASRTTFASQAQFVDQLKQGCQLCHQLGNRLTRGSGTCRSSGFKDTASSVGPPASDRAAGWRDGQSMATRMGRKAVLNMYAKWTDAIAAGAVPEAPPRPKGVERNVVVTLWDWGTPTSYMHDEIDDCQGKADAQRQRARVHRRRGARQAASCVDPAGDHRASDIAIPTRDDPKAMRSRFPQQRAAAVAALG